MLPKNKKLISPYPLKCMFKNVNKPHSPIRWASDISNIAKYSS